MSSSDRPRFAALTTRQRLLLVLFLLGIPLVLFALVEVGLRIGGYGSGFPLFTTFEEDSRFLIANPEIGRRYFQHEAGMPRPMADMFLADKEPGTFRIFVQGASSAAGFPYYRGGSFSRMLEQRLQATFPERTIEVVNVSIDATNSHTLLDLAPEIIEQQPDAVLIYAGHNEYYGVLGVASAESVGRSPAVVRSYLALRRLRTIQLLQGATERAAAVLWRITNRPAPSTRTLMEYLGSEHTVPYPSSLHDAGPRQLRRNLDDLLARYAEAGIPVFVGTVASNERDQPPFLGRPAEGGDSAAWQAGLARARDALAAGDPTTAAAAAADLLAADSTAADPWFLRGRALEAAGDTASAAEAYAAARDRDQLPFRAPSKVNEVIREAARRHGARIVESRAALAGASPGAIVGRSVMLEHLHPNIEGQFLLADAYYRALREENLIGDWSGAVSAGEARANVPVTPVDSIAGELMIARLTSRFPFVPAGTPAGPPPARPADPVGQLAHAYHRGRLPWIQAQGRLQSYYASQGNWLEVARVNRIVAQEAAHAPEPLLYAAQAEIRAGREERALTDLDEADRRLRTGQAAVIRGQMAFARGDTAAARSWFDEGIARDRGDRSARLARQALDALPGLIAATGNAPDEAQGDALMDLATAYMALGDRERARTHAEQALRITPGHPGATRLLRQLGAD